MSRVCGFRPQTALQTELSRGVEHEEQIDSEHEEMNGTLQHVGAALSEGEDGDRENNEEEGDLRVFQAEDDLASGKEPDGQCGGYGESDGREDGSEEDVDRALQLVVQGGLHGGEAFGGENERCYDQPAKSGGQAADFGGEFEDAGQFLGQDNDGDDVSEQQ